MADNSSFNLFGFEIRRKQEEPSKSFAPPVNEDGSAVVTTAGSYSAYQLDVDQINKRDERGLIFKYRDLSNTAEIDRGIEEIVNEAIVYSDFERPVKLDFTADFDERFSDKTKELLIKEFNEVLDLLKFDTDGNEVFRRWYVDGRLAYHIITYDNVRKGIKELRYVDTANLKKIKEVKKDRNEQGFNVLSDGDEYYVYNEKGFASTEKTGIRISADSIIYITSGVFDANTKMVLSHLHKAIRPANQLRMVEDATLIYRTSRAPERRVFYIDTGDMPRTKAEQYIKDVMARYRNKQVYDVATGEIKDDKRHLSMMEDFWLPRGNNNKGTEISTLPGAQNLGVMEDVEYFKDKVYNSLNVPVSRLQPGQGMSIGRSNEITRDEVKFQKFVDRLRKRFNRLFIEALKTNLILKGIASLEDWEFIESNILFNYNQDNLFSEFKETEILRERLSIIQIMDPYIGRFFSDTYVFKNVLRLTDDEIINMKEEIKEYNAEQAAEGGTGQDGVPEEEIPSTEDQQGGGDVPEEEIPTPGQQ